MLNYLIVVNKRGKYKVYMQVNPVKQFVKNNISRFEKSSKGRNFICNLYDKNNVYRGEYSFSSNGSDYLGVRKSRSHTRIMSEDLKLEMQEFVYMNKDYVSIYDPMSDLKRKALPREITTITTVLDYINDKFITLRNVSKLKNNLQKINNDNPDWICSESFVIYEPLAEKPQYEKSTEYIREGSISEINKKIRDNMFIGGINQIPYRYW